MYSWFALISKLYQNLLEHALYVQLQQDLLALREHAQVADRKKRDFARRQRLEISS